jgi:hypothetical protein
MQLELQIIDNEPGNGSGESSYRLSIPITSLELQQLLSTLTHYPTVLKSMQDSKQLEFLFMYTMKLAGKSRPGLTGSQYQSWTNEEESYID